MDCRKFQKNLENYLEGGLDFPGRFGMERHAQQCFGCGHELAGARKLSQMARELERVQAPPDFEAAVLNRIRAKGSRSRFWALRRFWIYGFDYPSARMIALGASALALLGFGIFFAVYRVDHGRQTAASLVSGTSTPISVGRDSGFVPASRGLEPSTEPDAGNVGALAPATLSATRARRDVLTEENSFAGQVEASEYGEYLVPGLGDGQMTVRLPKTIRLRYGQPSEEYYIRNVSH